MSLKHLHRGPDKFLPLLIIDKADCARIHILKIRHIIIIVIPALSIWIAPCKPPVCRGDNIPVEILGRFIYDFSGYIIHLIPFPGL